MSGFPLVFAQSHALFVHALMEDQQSEHSSLAKQTFLARIRRTMGLFSPVCTRRSCERAERSVKKRGAKRQWKPPSGVVHPAYVRKRLRIGIVQLTFALPYNAHRTAVAVFPEVFIPRKGGLSKTRAQHPKRKASKVATLARSTKRKSESSCQRARPSRWLAGFTG